MKPFLKQFVLGTCVMFTIFMTLSLPTAYYYAGLSNAFDRKLAGERDGATYRLDIDDVCYAETVDGRTFLYTEDAVYQTPLRLYELEDKLAGTEFVRASKQLLANFDHVVAIRPALNARLQLLLDNGESVMVSRQYAPTIKRKLDL